MPSISFLLGAGFSKPAGYPLASEVNEHFVGLKESDITIHTDGSAWFNGGEPNPNDWFMRKDQRDFAEQLLAYYCNAVVTPETFHYETFYDWYKDLLEGATGDPEVDAIAVGIGQRTGNLLLNFDLTFNQLLADLITRHHPEVHLARGLPLEHARFLDLVERLAEDSTLHFHTLNHDLFFESLSSTDAMKGELADGFTDLGSPFYGKLRHVVKGPNGGDWYSYPVRLRRFTDTYGSRFNLYKLHGSIDNYVFPDEERTTVRSRRGIGPNDLMKEVSEGGTLKYQADHSNYYPDFLSGTNYKTRRYASSSYYESVFEHFKADLASSPVLVCIGYGFGDAEINRLIETHLLRQPDARVLVVDVSLSKNMPKHFEGRTQFFPGGVSDFDLGGLTEAILNILGSRPKS